MNDKMIYAVHGFQEFSPQRQKVVCSGFDKQPLLD